MWIIHYKKSVRSSTYTVTKALFQNHILPILGKLSIDEIDLKVAQKAVDSWSEKLKKFKSLKSYSQQIYKFAMRLELVTKDPFKFIIMPHETSKSNNHIKSSENFYNKEQLLIFLEIAKRELPYIWYCFIRLISYTGIRRGEALALTWQDIDFEQKEITISKTLSWDENFHKTLNPSKTKAGERKITIDHTTLEVLNTWKDLQKENQTLPNELIFQNQNNDYFCLSTPQKYLDKIIKKHNLKRITIHGLRHTHCSLLFEAGVPIKQVQDRLGHDDIKTTLDIYTHITSSQKKQALETFMEFMNQK